MTEEDSEMERISILIEPENKEKLLEICKQQHTDLSKFLRELIRQVIS